MTLYVAITRTQSGAPASWSGAPDCYSRLAVPLVGQFDFTIKNPSASSFEDCAVTPVAMQPERAFGGLISLRKRPRRFMKPSG